MLSLSRIASVQLQKKSPLTHLKLKGLIAGEGLEPSAFGL